MSTLPLTGLKVLDLSRVLAGPYCAMTLGDLGASVIKVERPVSGDETRGWGPPFDADGFAAYFLSTNRNKLSIAADFSVSSDVEVIRALAADADVVIENFLPGSLARYGLDEKALLATNIGLIWCTISGFGPLSSRPGYDFVVQAESGWMSITGPEDGPPMRTGVALVDVMAGKDAATAILAALAGRERGLSIERNISITLMGSAAAALVNVAQNSLVTGQEAKRWGNAHPNLVPYQLFQSADGPIVIAVGSDAQWRAAAAALGLGGLEVDPALATNAGRLERRNDVVAAIAARVVQHPAAHWMERLTDAGVPCGLVRSVVQALRDVETSPRTGVAPSTGGSVRYSPPRLNQHGALIRTFHWSAFDHVPILAIT